MAVALELYANSVHFEKLEALEREMAKTTELKHHRVHLRMDTRTKRKLERAAAYEEMTVSRFVLANAVAAAERVIESRERVVLSAMDWEAFHNALSTLPSRTQH